MTFIRENDPEMRKLSELISGLWESGEIKAEMKNDYYTPKYSKYADADIVNCCLSFETFIEDCTDINDYRVKAGKKNDIFKVMLDQAMILAEDCQAMKNIASNHDEQFLARDRIEENLDCMGTQYEGRG